MSRLIPTLVLLMLASCGGTPDGEDASTPPDGDAGPSVRDSGETQLDAGSPLDASGDGGLDGDGDGVPASLDCDDTDTAIGRSWTRACDSDCDPAASETCTDGTWGACETGPACMCPMDGATRVVDCAMCGTQAQSCSLGMWTSTSECLGGGECEAGAAEERMFRCGRSQRICDADCGWGEWIVVEGDPAECEPGTVRCVPGMYRHVCTDACMWRFATMGECDAG